MSKRVVVAMSGGVDSSVAAALLKQRGYEVIGMMMRLWAEPAADGLAHNRCCTPGQMADARRIANLLDIPFYVLDTRDVFRRRIVDFFIEGHRQGVTPNPCLECNRHIRFDWLQGHALALDADYLATGHHARISRGPDGRYQLLRAVDRQKDQSYVLSVMGQKQLAHALFPIGDYCKSEVRDLAREFGLPTAAKQDSQDLCFLGDGDYRRFLRDHAPELLRAGPVLRRDGTQLGEHSGLANYTIGQRRGLGINSPVPMYVFDRQARDNALIVAEREEQGARRLQAERFNWVAGTPPDKKIAAAVSIRYGTRPQPATVTPLDQSVVDVAFEQPQVGVAPGQAAVVYADENCLGGGVIRSAE
ncbi:MAG: tRNA 2-thiouridine(34) synthase MnmA [Anaerolineaceae bacterium]|nr:tRNA 2-thiouridine(34) synthase MnmA [Anaerolineaceae bacterium]